MAMASLIKRRRGKRHYYSLIHNTGRRQHEKYLGRQIPEDIEQIKRDFYLSVLRAGWAPQTGAMSRGYRARPEPVIAQDLEEFSFAFTHDTQKIEGSSLTRKETHNLLRFSVTPGGKPVRDTEEALRHHDVWLKMVKDPAPVTEETVLGWHREMFSNTKPDMAGRLRTCGVHVTNSRSAFPHWKAVPRLMSQLVSWYKSPGIEDPAELAGTVHFRLESIHPFGDGNGRAGRMLMNHALVRGGMPPLNIRYADRLGYFRALEAGQTGMDEMHFLEWFMRYYARENARYADDDPR